MTGNRVRYWILLADLAWINVASFWVLSLRFGFLRPGTTAKQPPVDITVILIAGAIIWTLLYVAMDLSGLDWASDLPDRTSRLILAVGTFILLLFAASYCAREYFPRLAFGYLAILVFVGLVAFRRLIRQFLSSMRYASAGRRAVILGDGRLARELARKIDKHQELNCRVVGFFSSAADERPGVDAPTRTSTLGILDFLKNNRITDLMLALPPPMSREVLALVARCQEAGIRINLIPEPYELYTSRPRLIEVGGLPLLTIDQHATSGWRPSFKAIPDRMFALLFLIVSSPLLLVLSLYLRMTGRKALQSEVRCGKNGALFGMHRLNIDRNARHMGWLESIVSATSLTELPQLWNVLLGEMSLVGPRPESPDRVKHYSEWNRQRLRVKPGITGYAQVQGLRDRHSSEEKTGFDLQYILHWSPVLDLALVLQTIWIIARRVGGTVKGTATQPVHAYRHGPTEAQP